MAEETTNAEKLDYPSPCNLLIFVGLLNPL